MSVLALKLKHYTKGAFYISIICSLIGLYIKQSSSTLWFSGAHRAPRPCGQLLIVLLLLTHPESQLYSNMIESVGRSKDEE